jgi:cytochrome c oxidase subunit 2
MGYLIGFLIFALIVIILLQVGKISSISDRIRGEEESFYSKNNSTAFWLVMFMIAFLVVSAVSAYYYRNYMLGYGPWEASSAHGGSIDKLFNVTLIITGIVFVITQILTFWYAYKYRQRKGGKAMFFAHDSKLELIWTAVPAIVMAFLVANGLVVWNDVMTDLGPNDSYMEIEATGYQFAWDLRYGGSDGRVGKKDFRMIDLATNSLGLDFTDPRNHDDIFLSSSDKIVLPVDTTIRVQITSKDVLHNFYLPHFRVKMDAVPGLPTYFIFKPTKTTAQMRSELKKYPEWNVPADPADPEGPKRYETFDYELACAELCGKGHYSMRRIVEIVDRDTYKKWVSEQPSFYLSKIRGTDADPNKDKRLLPMEIKNREKELNKEIKDAVSMAKDTASKEEAIVKLKNLYFETGSAKLEADSYFEIDHTARLLNKYSDVMLEVSGHTDNVGDPAANRILSQQRAEAVKARLIEKGVLASRLSSLGYGDTKPEDTNDTEEGKAKNRRTELKVIAKN